MSLRIQVYTTTEHPEKCIFDEAVGAEVWRRDLYSSPAVKSLGCELLPFLFDPTDTEVQGNALKHLAQEIAIVIANKELVVQETGCNAEYFDEDFKAISQAVQLAQEVGGRVEIL